MSYKVLTEYEHIRLRPEMYIGQTVNPYSLIREAIDNAVDEWLSGYARNIAVKQTKDGWYEVRDDGRGIPASAKGVKGDLVLTLTTKLFSGGKFSKKLYKISTGLHGIGLVAINALSDEFEVITRTSDEDTFRHYKFINGVNVAVEQLNVEKSKLKKWSTVIRFKPSPKYFDSVHTDDEIIIERLQSIVNFQKYYKGSSLPAVKVKYNNKKITPVDLTEYKMYKGKDITVYVKMNNSHRKQKFMSYINTLPVKRGIHRDQFEKYIIKHLSDKIKFPKTIIAKEDLPKLFDVHMFILTSNVSFSSQHKTELSTKRLKLPEDIFAKIANDFHRDIQTYVDGLQNGNLSKQLKELRGKKKASFDQIRLALKKNKVLYIVEGESAAGTVIRARDVETEAVFALRGKLLNFEKATKTQVKNNKEVQTLASFLSTYLKTIEKIVIVADADPDGRHITVLCLKLFKNILPELIRQGKLYVIEPPLFGVYKNKKFIPIYSEQEAKKYKNFVRFKGLGEMEVDEMREIMRNGRYIRVTL